MAGESTAAPLRSPLLMNPQDTLLLVIDVQDKLWPAIAGREAIGANIDFLLSVAEILGVGILATEQYPKGLGTTMERFAARIERRIAKTAFSAGLEPDVMAQLDPLGVRKILIVGIEAHVCVAQTAMDLLASGFQVYIAADAVGSRNPRDAEIALQRLASAGVTLTTSEAAAFEWTRESNHREFKAISKLIKDRS